MRLELPLLVALAVATGFGGAGCRGGTTQDAPIVGIRNMYDQPRYDPQTKSEFFADERTMRSLPPGTVAREMEVAISTTDGRTDDDTGWLLEVPASVVSRVGGMDTLVARGRERHDIYCAPCHGLSGDGNGPVAIRAKAIGAAAFSPANFHDPRIRTMPDGQLYATITNGIRNMPPYRHSIPLDDRWAIVTYVRALQLSRAAASTALNTHGQVNTHGQEPSGTAPDMVAEVTQ